MSDAPESPTRLERGSQFAGYRIEGLLARGGMGVVYKATDVDLDRTVALKIIAPEHTQNADAVARFKSEARLAASLEHPNIVPIHRGGEFDGVLYLAMRLVPGTNLRELIDGGPLALDRIDRIIAQVADALDTAHERGLVHRDVKPANILISDEGGNEHVYLTDFGLTKRLGSEGSLTRTGTWVGTPDYIAPEQIQAGGVDGRTDVYSLGCVLYEMLTGGVAFPRENDVAKLWAHVTDSPPPPSMKRPDLVKDFDEVVARATAKDPDQRYRKPSELAAAVHRAVAEQGSKLAGGAVEGVAGPGMTVASTGRHETFIAEPTHAPAQPAGDQQQSAAPSAPVAASAAAGASAAAASAASAPLSAGDAQQPATPPPGQGPPGGTGQPPGPPDGGSGEAGWLRRHRWPLAAGLALVAGIAATVVVLSSTSSESLGDAAPATLAAVPTNHVDGAGDAVIRLKGDVATVTLDTKGLLNGAAHAMHIHAGALGKCPPASAARLHNGHEAISTSNGVGYYGVPRTALTTTGDTSAASILAFQRYPTAGNIAYKRTFKLKPSVVNFIRRDDAVIVVHGIDYNGNGIYDGVLDRSELDPEVQGETTAPALCGPLVAPRTNSSASASAPARRPGGTLVYTASLTLQTAPRTWLCHLGAVTS